MSKLTTKLKVHQLLARVLSEAKRQGYILGPYDGYVEEAEVWPNFAVAATAPSYVVRFKMYGFTGIQDWEFYGTSPEQASDQALNALRSWYQQLLAQKTQEPPQVKK